jgi:carboxylesterase
MASMDNAIYLQKHLRGLVEFVVLDDSYHIITLDRQRHIVVDRCVAFVNRIAEGQNAVVESDQDLDLLKAALAR